MSKNPGYAPDIWNKIQRLPFMVAIGMEGTGKSGLAGSAQERNATFHSILEARDSYPDNTFIQGLLPPGTGEQGMEAALNQHDMAMDQLEEKGIVTIEGLTDHLHTCLKETMPLILENEGQKHHDEFKEWLLHIASEVALSAKEGDFFGIGGQRFSDAEKRYYESLHDLLNTL